MSEYERLAEKLQHPDNPIVFLQMAAGGAPIGRIVIELFADVTPRTAENFRQFCTGEMKKDGVPIGYKNAQFHRIIKVRRRFRERRRNGHDEHLRAEFFVTCAKCEFLDGKHVVFGRVLDGLLTVRKIENVPTGQNGKPKMPIVIEQCGEL
ncbi:Peptidyl-prolyl cis-trans isomerase [Aphelenchoides fujianensis]|nr:Peptidyl-prolyl cis-trans isomerase [Aphelenchoides fujianensis]